MEAVGAYNYIYKAQQLGVNVVAVNNSWGAGADGEDDGEDSEVSIMKEIINMVGKKGAISVCAAGNESLNNDEEYIMPANIDSPYIISVAATNEKDELAKFSNYGSCVDIAAPGTSILSSVSYDCFNPILYTNKEDYCLEYHDFESEEPVEIEDKKQEESSSLKEEELEESATVKEEESEEGQTDETGTKERVEENSISMAAPKNQIGYKMKNDGDGEVSVRITYDNYFGAENDGTKSLEWKVSDAQKGDTYTLYFPYDALKSSTAMHCSAFVKMVGPQKPEDSDSLAELLGLSSIVYFAEGKLDDNEKPDENALNLISGGYADGKNNYWSFFSGKSESRIRKDQKRAVIFELDVDTPGDYKVYIDNVAVSKPDVEEKSFGKYDFYNGTSMATPHVTGAVAAVADSFADETALQRKARLLGSVRKTDKLEGMVNTSGVLDFANITSPKMSAEKAILNDKKQIEIDGYHMENVTVSINKEKITPVSQDANKIVIDGKNYLNKTILIEIEKQDEKIEQKLFFADGKEFKKETGIEGTLNAGKAVSAGDGIYYVAGNGDVSFISEMENQLMWDYVSDNGYSAKIFGDDYKTAVDYKLGSVSDVVCIDDTLYTVLYLDEGYSENIILASFDKKNGWKKVCDIPEEFEELEGVTLAAYQGVLYLMGGFDTKSETCSKAVMQYDAKEKKWNKAAELPEGRFYAKALQVGKNLVLTLGSDGAGANVKTLIFDGTKWTVSKSDIGEIVEPAKYTYSSGTEKKTIPVAKAQIGMIKDGIVYTNMKVESKGDTIIYTVSTDSYKGAEYSLNAESLKGDEIFASTLKDKFYVFYGYGFDDEDVEIGLGTVKNASDEETIKPEEIEGLDSSVKVLSMQVTGGFTQVKDTSAQEDAYVEGIGYYLPGDTITLTPSCFENYYITSFVVDGKEIQKDSKGNYKYSAKVDGTVSLIKTSAKAGAYVTEMFMMDESLSLPKGTKAYQLFVDFMPDNATNKKLKWASTNSKVVTVNQKGQVTVAKNAKVGQTATVTATAMDRGKITAKCVIKITKETVAKNSKFKVGKFTYQVTDIGKKNEVSCIAFNNKKAKKATLPKTVKKDGMIFNITSIGKKAFKKCKNLKQLKIKSETIAKIGKGTWKGTKKKLVIKVPKKVKKVYKKKLKKSGFKGKIK